MRRLQMDGSNWRQFLFNYEDIMRAALVAEGGAGVPEADVLFSALRDITVICSKSREQLQRHHILRCKLSAFAFARTMEALTSSCYFTKRCRNGLFSQDIMYIYIHYIILYYVILYIYIIYILCIYT